MEHLELESRSEAITDGTLYAGHPSVGFVLIGGSTSCSAAVLQGEFCTATLVGKRTVILAAHCIKPGKHTIFCLKAGGTTYQIQTLIPHTNWDPQTIQNDIGLIVLNTAPPVTPSVLSNTAPTTGLKITLVGFGITASGLKDAGKKRIATNSIRDLWETRFSFAGTGNGIGNTCDGDSGGPAFATLDGREVQIGVTSSGLTPCGTLGYDTRVDHYYESWIKPTANGDLYDPTVQDTEKPQVAITAPADNTEVDKQVTVKATVTDNVGVVEVQLLVDGQLKANKTSPPYEFPATLSDGEHTLKVVAIDGAGNQGEDVVTVGVGGPPVKPPVPENGAFGAKCANHSDCMSNLCANQTYCTQYCDPTSNNCPSGAECLNAGEGLYVCGPPASTHSFEEVGALTGGCAVGQGQDREDLSGWWLLLLAALFGVWRRRR